ncbi:MAG: TetR/AcrR family transcriptional regulator [Egibacteraceae bacterium]
MFWRNGHAATSTRDLATALGISQSSLYNAVGSKAELLRTAMDRYEAAVDAQVVTPLLEADEGVGVLWMLFDALRRWVADDGRPGCTEDDLVRLGVGNALGAGGDLGALVELLVVVELAARVTVSGCLTRGRRLLGRRQVIGRQPSPQTLTALLDGRQRLLQHDLEVGELAVDVVLGLQAQHARVLARVGEDPFGLAVGCPDHLGLREHALALDTGVGHQLLRLARRLGQQVVALLDDPAGLPQLVGQPGAHVGEHRLDLGPVHHDRRGQRDGSALGDQLLELLDGGLDVQGASLLEVDGIGGGQFGDSDGWGVPSRYPSPQPLTQPVGDHGRHEVGDVTAEARNLLHQR